MAGEWRRGLWKQYGTPPRAGPEYPMFVRESIQAWAPPERGDGTPQRASQGDVRGSPSRASPWDWPEARPSGDVAVGRRGPDPPGSPMTQSLPYPDAWISQSKTASCWIQRLCQCAQDGIHTSNAPPLRRRFCRSLWAGRTMGEGVNAP